MCLRSNNAGSIGGCFAFCDHCESHSLDNCRFKSTSGGRIPFSKSRATPARIGKCQVNGRGRRDWQYPCGFRTNL
jgi:hypothetical protein